MRRPGLWRYFLWAAPAFIFRVDVAMAQEGDALNTLVQTTVGGLSDLNAYDSDIGVDSGDWLHEIVHLRLADAARAEAVFLEFEPRLRTQLAEILKSRLADASPVFVRFHEYRLPIASCAGVPERIQTAASVIRDAVAGVGHRPPAPTELVVDGRLLRVALRIGRGSVAEIAVSENDSDLFPPLDAMMRSVADCARKSSWVPARVAVTLPAPAP